MVDRSVGGDAPHTAGATTRGSGLGGAGWERGQRWPLCVSADARWSVRGGIPASGDRILTPGHGWWTRAHRV